MIKAAPKPTVVPPKPLNTTKAVLPVKETTGNSTSVDTEPHIVVSEGELNTIKDKHNSKNRKVEKQRKQANPNYRQYVPDKQVVSREHQDQKLYVHLIAHTHDDVGWLKTVDEYYSGTNQESQHVTVSLILDSVIEELLKDPKRKFTYVEMKFFTMWYWRQTEETRNNVKRLVREGRLEFSNGGWSATDEACANYEDIINNMLVGHQFLKEEFGVIPKTGWHIDAFGHSTTNARLFSDFGFDAVFFSRLDRADKEEKKKRKAFDFLWRPMFKHFGTRKQIMVSMFKDHYCWIPDFQMNDNDNFETDPTLESFNAEEKMRHFINYIHNIVVPGKRVNHIALPWGCDF